MIAKRNFGIPLILHYIGTPFHRQLVVWREIIRLTLLILAKIFQPKAWRWNEIMNAIVQNGVGSLPLLAISTSFAGVVITHQIAWHMDLALHDVSMIPGFTGQFIFRELGIAIPALLLVSKVGASITAEVATMKVTDQLDALKLLGVDTVGYLVFPRWIASILSGGCLTLISVSVTLFCSIVVAVSEYHFGMSEFINALVQFISIQDLACALIKGTLYGAIIPLISCAYGFLCQGGAEGVGKATTQAVVTSTITVISFDFILTYIFSAFL